MIAQALVLSVCASAAAQPKELMALKGQPVQPVIDKLGPPASEQKTGGSTTYVWNMEALVDTPTRTTTTEYSAGRPNSVETMVMRPQRQTCILRLVADGAGTIGEVEPKGPFPACAAIVDKLIGPK